MPKLQDTLQKAVNTVFDLMDDGETARSAIIKTASGQHLLPDQVTRLCQLYNRSASITQRIAPADLNIKLADAQIVDPREVLKDLTERRTPKTAALCPKAETLVTLSRKTLVDAPKYSGRIVNQKTAAIVVEPPPVDRYAGLHHGVKGEQLVGLRAEIKRKIAGYQHEGHQMLAYMEAATQTAARAVEKIIQETNLETYKQAHFWIRTRSPDALPLLEMLAAKTGTDYQQRKVAAIQTSEAPALWSDRVTGPKGVVAYVTKLAAAVKQFKEAAPGIAAKIAALREEDYIIRTHIRGDTVVNRDIVFGGTLKSQQLDHIRKVANMVNSYIGSVLAKGKAGIPSLSEVEKYKIKLQHPRHDAQLRGVRARTALQSLLVDDPVIASHPEEEVVSAFNEVAEYSPGVTENPAALRSVLRQYLQNNASTFDLTQLRQLERGDGMQTT